MPARCMWNGLAAAREQRHPIGECEEMFQGMDLDRITNTRNDVVRMMKQLSQANKSERDQHLI